MDVHRIKECIIPLRSCFHIVLWVVVIFIALDGAMKRDTLPFSDGKRFDLAIVERHF
jgi:hypothetical protein